MRCYLAGSSDFDFCPVGLNASSANAARKTSSVASCGAYGGWWQADPNDGSVLIFLAHNMVRLEQLVDGVRLGVWSAIRDFQLLGSAAL